MHANGIPAGICYCFHSCSILGISKWPWDRPQMEIPWALTSPRLRQHRRSQHVVWYLEGRLKGSPLGRSVTHGVLFDLDLATVIGNTQFEFRKSNEFNMIPHDSSCTVYQQWPIIVGRDQTFLLLADWTTPSLGHSPSRCIGFQLVSPCFQLKWWHSVEQNE